MKFFKEFVSVEGVRSNFDSLFRRLHQTEIYLIHENNVSDIYIRINCSSKTMCVSPSCTSIHLLPSLLPALSSRLTPSFLTSSPSFLTSSISSPPLPSSIAIHFSSLEKGNEVMHRKTKNCFFCFSSSLLQIYLELE